MTAFQKTKRSILDWTISKDWWILCTIPVAFNPRNEWLENSHFKWFWGQILTQGHFCFCKYRKIEECAFLFENIQCTYLMLNLQKCSGVSSLWDKKWPQNLSGIKWPQNLFPGLYRFLIITTSEYQGQETICRLFFYFNICFSKITAGRNFFNAPV